MLGKDKKQSERKVLVLICARAPQATDACMLQNLTPRAEDCMLLD